MTYGTTYDLSIYLYLSIYIILSVKSPLQGMLLFYKPDTRGREGEGLGCLPLHVEVGRYRTRKIPYHLRTCNLCINSVETEFHFVMECPTLQALRSCFFDCLSHLDNSFTPSPKLRNFLQCANNHCGIICIHICITWM